MAAKKGDAVCFTAGPRGALFALGVIHAYLAARRDRPTVVAGVSVGALSAAAMQRCYQEIAELKGADEETLRWKWFRRYLGFLVERPLDLIWNSVPDVSDLLAKRPPIRETAIPADSEGDKWLEREQGARMEYYLLVKTIQFATRIDIRLSDVARMAIHYVRSKEHYKDRPFPHVAKVSSGIVFWGMMLRAAFKLFITLLCHPGFYWPRPYGDYIRKESERKKGKALGWVEESLLLFKTFVPRPLFGWDWLLIGVCIPVPLATVATLRVAIWTGILNSDAPRLGGALAICGALLLVGSARILWSVCRGGLAGLAGSLLERVELRNSILTDFQLRLALDALFRDDKNRKGRIGEKGQADALLVASPLEVLLARNSAQDGPEKYQLMTQVYTQSGVGQPVAEALAACLAIPALLKPQLIPETEAEKWVAVSSLRNGKAPKGGFHLVDGAQVCANPIPPLFDQLKRWYGGGSEVDKEKTEGLFAKDLTDFRVHLVHSTPLIRKMQPERTDLAEKGKMEPLPGSVECALKGLRLSKRRDAQLEVWQTNYQSEMALAMEYVTGKPAEDPEKPGQRMLPILIDEIAPVEDLNVANPLRPAESELLRQAAAGCRATMAVLFRKEVGKRGIKCSELMKRVRGAGDGNSNSTYPGVAEICRHCTQMISLTERDVAFNEGTPFTKFIREKYLPKAFRESPGELMPPAIGKPPKNEEQRAPRIVFVASGGVFRGSFHIGMVGAMHAIGMKPDLIVGASVGTMMGAALGELFSTGDEGTLHRLVDTFVEVNDKVALTRQFKSAMRDLSTRAQMVNLSPADFRRKILEGAGQDPTFATAGAPAELIDAISRLFLIPHRKTQQLAADFVGEDVAGAVARFIGLLKDQTAERLGIRESVLGTSLLELAITKILKKAAEDKSNAQPYLKSGIGFLATTVNLTDERMEILGLRVPAEGKSYDFIQAALSSSAFPLAFPARRESHIYPETGRRDVFFGDGGMFDNLPLMPATLAVSAGQLHSLTAGNLEWKSLEQRIETPDLYVVGALDIDASEDPNENHGQSVFTILKRANSLQKNMKTRRYERFVARMDRILRPIVKREGLEHRNTNDAKMAEIINGFVHAGVMVTTPEKKEYLNGTFAFCESLQMDKAVIRRSIAHGCFRLLKQVAELQTVKGDEPEKRAMRALTQISSVTPIPKKDRKEVQDNCPHFSLGSTVFDCPFVHEDHREVLEECKKIHKPR